MASMDEDLQAGFGRVIRTMRHSAELSQEALAEAAGLHQVYISQMERGLKSPSLRTIARLARALGVRPSELVAAAERRRGHPGGP